MTGMGWKNKIYFYYYWVTITLDLLPKFWLNNEGEREGGIRYQKPGNFSSCTDLTLDPLRKIGRKILLILQDPKIRPIIR